MGNKKLVAAIKRNARIRVVFGGMGLDEAKSLAEEFFLAESNERWCKQQRTRVFTEYEEVPYEIEQGGWADQTNWSESGEQKTDGGGFATSGGVTRGTRFEPRLRREPDGQEDFSREEKIAKLAERLFWLKPRECYIDKMGTAYHYAVPYVREYLKDSSIVLDFEKALLSNAFPSHEIDTNLKQEELQFLERGKGHESVGSRTKKKPARLHPQG